ncbi:unnamed protein product [Penicillium glandicola]
MTAAGVSPSSSPRLPSPPPFTEVQIGTQSPSVGESSGKDADLSGVAMAENDGSTRRIRPGTKSADMASGPPVIPLSQLDSPFQLQEHIKAQYHKLAPRYPKLMEKYDVLNEKYGVLKGKYDVLKKKRDILIKEYSDKVDPSDVLTGEYNGLIEEYDMLMGEYNVLTEEYNEQSCNVSGKVDRESKVAEQPTEPLESEVVKEPTEPTEPARPESDVANELTRPPEGVHVTLWQYELCRFFTMEVNRLINAFFSENPPCSSKTCPEMRVIEWQYLCATHEDPQPCCAIDYCCHTLDWATDTLTSPTNFPSRLTLGSKSALKHLKDIFRRLYRIFAHAWFQHNNVFLKVDRQDGLYVFFKTVCVHYEFIGNGNWTIPLKAGGPDEVAAAAAKKKAAEENAAEEKPVETNKRFTILRKEGENSFGATAESQDPALVTGATTRRHKHSPSTGSRVATIAEGAEDLEEVRQTPSPLHEGSEQSPELRPVSVLEIQTSEERTATDERPTDVGKSSEERVEESQEHPPQEPYEQRSETPEDQENTEQTEQTKEPISEESTTNTESPIEKSGTEGDENITSCEEPTPSEEPEAKIEAAQEPSVALETKDEPEKEES